MERPKQMAESATSWGWAMAAQALLYVSAAKEALHARHTQTAARIRKIGGAIVAAPHMVDWRGLAVAFAQAEPFIQTPQRSVVPMPSRPEAIPASVLAAVEVSARS